MRIYKLELNYLFDGCFVTYHPNKRAAERAAKMAMDDDEDGEIERERTKIEAIDFQPTKAGILDMLRRYTPETDNG